MPRLLVASCLLLVCGSAASAQPWFAPTVKAPPKMPLTGLAPSKIVPELCIYHYPVSTRSPECQTFCDQGLGYYYSYVWIEAARCFETALKHDPECAFAWLGLHRALEKWGSRGTTNANAFLALSGSVTQPKTPDRFTKPPRDYAIEEARRLMPKANHREQLLIQAKLQEKGMWPDTPAADRMKKAQATLDELLTLYDDDEEGWYTRASIAEGANAKAPLYKALLKINPYHPGANHELVHFYENIRRPALGWPFAEGYMKSSPGIPHAFHMQAHLAMRIGKWQSTSDWSWRAIEMQKAYHKTQGVKPSEDHQFNHHMETLTRGLVHDGRFTEAKQIKKEAEGYGYTFRPEWFRMAIAQKDWPEAQKMVDQYKSDKVTASYYAAVIALEQGNTEKATAAVDVLRQAMQKSRNNTSNERRLWEVQGRLLCQQGQGEAGTKLIKRIIAKTKDDYYHHAWGGGAVYMEWWGAAALEGGVAAEAEEAFQEALAHDAGSVRGALGLWALCQRLGKTEEAERYLKVAKRCWAKADPKDFETLRADFAKKAANVPTAAVAVGGEN